MFVLLTLLFGFLTLVQPWPANAFFLAAKAAAQFNWGVGHWQLTQPLLEFRIADTTTQFSEQITNGQFQQQLEGWGTAGAVSLVESTECDAVPRPVVRIGAPQFATQNLITDNQLTQTFSSGSEQTILVQYCLVSWETLPLFDEPALSIYLNDELAWEDAPLVGAANQQQPVVSGWRTAVLTLPETNQITVRISAGNTIDPTNPTIAYIAAVSTAVQRLRSDAEIQLHPAAAATALKVTVQGEQNLQFEQAPLPQTIQLPYSLITQNQGTSEVLVEQFAPDGQSLVTPFYIYHPAAPPSAPSVTLQTTPAEQLVTAYFAAPADALSGKLARYKIWQRPSQQPQEPAQQVPISSYSFLWHGPRLPGGQEYLTFPWQVGSLYQFEVVDGYGQSSRTDWLDPAGS